MSGKRRYKTYRATLCRAGLDDGNVDFHPNAVAAAIYPVPMKKISADPRTSYGKL
jgi:hypothetical protein